MSWYHNAVFYQALVGSFKADGDKEVGTLRGVIVPMAPSSTSDHRCGVRYGSRSSNVSPLTPTNTVGPAITGVIARAGGAAGP